MVEHIKSALILVWNDDGELALQLRSANDDSFPLHWDFSAGGTIEEGENERLTAKRELSEEMGVTAPIELVAQARHRYQAWDPSITREVDMFIYTARHNGPFTPDPHEVEKIEFFTPTQIGGMMQAGEKFHPEFRFVWEQRLFNG